MSESGLDWRMAEILNGGLVRTRRMAGNAMCLCPAHADRTPSLGIKEKNGTLVYHCYARCGWDAIWRAIRAMGYDPLTTEQTRDDVRPPVIRAEGVDKSEHEARFRANYVYAPYEDPDWTSDPRAVPRVSDAASLRARYVYRDGVGHPMMLVHRYETDHDGEVHKLFIPVTPWLNTKRGRLEFPDRTCPEPRVPYGAETFRRPGPVVFVEGEKCRDAVDALLGHRVAVGSLYGSDPKTTDLSAVSDRTLVIVRDLDVPGEVYAERLDEHHGGTTVTVTPPYGGGDLATAPVGWDVADDVAGKAGVEPLTAEGFLDHLRGLARRMTPRDADVLVGAVTEMRRAIAGDDEA